MITGLLILIITKMKHTITGQNVCKLLRGILGSVSGSMSNLQISKKGIIFVPKVKKKSTH